MLAVAKALNLALAFALELATLAAVGWWGWRSADGRLRIVAVVALPLVLAAIWGLCGAPRAPITLRGVGRLAFEVAWFGCGVLALVLGGRGGLAAALAALLVVNAAAVRLLPPSRPHGRAVERGS